MTPFDAAISVFTTFALSTMTFPPSALIVTAPPLTVFALFNFTTSAAFTLPGQQPLSDWCRCR